ncbi:hypothetical protein EYF80_008675 [Liparis tanakae]|uniref:Uncharacterized protein n=1 Tax=Liparis tanakae TaxID=230148 RepID=A0A4Z2ISN6_9TELE|nr:hypothetical protein EYF80_008675 [Liparis tanakae]
MMRTLQKPRKNRPSKRQVNHRRFLHNMIQRKFADIEAANHRLAFDQPGSPQAGYLQEPDTCSAHTDVDGISKARRDASGASQEAETSEKTQPDSGHLWKRHPKSQRSACTARKNNQSKEKQKQETRNQPSSSSSTMSPLRGTDCEHGAELLQAEGPHDEGPLKTSSSVSEDSGAAQHDSVPFIQHVDASPSLSPLSLDLCDFSIQMFTDISTRTQDEKSAAGISESQWTDIMDLFGGGGQDSGGGSDAEAYFESVGMEVGADDEGFADRSQGYSNRCEMEELPCETGDYRYQYSCQGSHVQSDQRSSQETQFNHFKANQETDVLQNEFSYHQYASELQAYPRPQVEGPWMLLGCDRNQHFTPFEGVAQSFSVPLHDAERRPIPTPPHEGWLFTDILKDRKSLDCEKNTSF